MIANFWRFQATSTNPGFNEENVNENYLNWNSKLGFSFSFQLRSFRICRCLKRKTLMFQFSTKSFNLILSDEEEFKCFYHSICIRARLIYNLNMFMKLLSHVVTCWYSFGLISNWECWRTKDKSACHQYFQPSSFVENIPGNIKTSSRIHSTKRGLA